MKKALLIIGGQSTAIEIYEVASNFYSEEFPNIYFVIGNNESKTNCNQIYDSEIDEYLNRFFCKYIISFSNHTLRNSFEKLMYDKGIESVNIFHPSAIISKSANIGIGNYIAANAVVSCNSKIENHNIINFNTTIGHDSSLKNHIIINPGARISGNVIIESNVLIGANSFVYQGKKIGTNSFVDAMTYVDRDIESKMICSSRQNKILKRVIF